METRIATSIEQSQKLIELGVDVNSADMHYVRQKTDFMGKPVDGKWSEPKYGNTNSKHAHYVVQNFSSYETIPAWSLAALYSVLPTFTLDSSDDKYFRIHCCNKFSEWYNNPIDATFEIILKLKEMNLL